MEIQVNGDTTGAEMFYLSILFRSLAEDRGFPVPKPERAAASQTSTIGEVSVTLNVDTANATSAVEALADLINRTGVKVEDVPPVNVTVREPVPNAKTLETMETTDRGEGLTPYSGADEMFKALDITPPATAAGEFIDPIASLPERTTDTNLDINGLPWDARIHAGSRERNTDGSWRVRRRPKGVEEADWDATLARVTAELTELMAIPVSPGAVADAAAETAEAMADCFGGEPSDYSTEPLTDAEVDAFVDIVQGVVVAPPVTIAPPVVVPPVTAVAPPITVDKPAIETFAQLMSWLTSRTPKDEAAKPAMVTRVNEILAANGLTTLQQLGQRADLIPQVLVQFQAAFGE
jgi:hypothetical protein